MSLTERQTHDIAQRGSEGFSVRQLYALENSKYLKNPLSNPLFKDEKLHLSLRYAL